MDALVEPTAVRFGKHNRAYVVEKAIYFRATPNWDTELFPRFVVPVCRICGKTGNQYSKWLDLKNKEKQVVTGFRPSAALQTV